MNTFLKQQAVGLRKKRRHRVRKVLLRMEQIGRVVLVWVLIVGALYGVYFLIFARSVFTVEQVVIRGDLRVVDEATIRTYAKLQLGEPLFGLSMRAIQERIRAHPWIREVAVRRKLPNTVWIYVAEREAAALLNGTVMSLVDRAGEVFKPAAAGELGDLPVVTGVGNLFVDADGVGHSAELTRLLEIQRMYERHPLADRYGCSEIILDRFGDISIVTEHPAMQLRLGNTPVVEQFDRLYSVLSAVTAERRISSVDLFLARKVVVRYAS